MMKILTIASISFEHFLIVYWPFLRSQNEGHSSSKSHSIVSKMSMSISSETSLKINIIYENLMTGLMIGLSFFHLLPLSSAQISKYLYTENIAYLSRQFPYGTLISIFVFVAVLVNSNYFYHANSTKSNLKPQNFRSRKDFEYDLLTNKKLKLRRRLAVENISTQLMVSLPSILSTSALAANNRNSIWLWCLLIIMFERHQSCSFFSKSYEAAGLSKGKVLNLIAVHIYVTAAYMFFSMLLTNVLPGFFCGILNAVTCGVFFYEIMIEKLSNNFGEKHHLAIKTIFLICGILISCLFDI